MKTLPQELENRFRLACFIASFCVQNDKTVWELAEKADMSKTAMENVLTPQSGRYLIGATLLKLETVLPKKVEKIYTIVPQQITASQWDNVTAPKITTTVRLIENPYRMYKEELKKHGSLVSNGAAVAAVSKAAAKAVAMSPVKSKGNGHDLKPTDYIKKVKVEDTDTELFIGTGIHIKVEGGKRIITIQ